MSKSVIKLHFNGKEYRLSLKIRESSVYQVFENKNAKENRILRLAKNKNVDMKSHLKSSFLNPC